ncbi:MAG: hypothetical protein QXR26_02225 [Candidatus Caldarchaeum sp.]
MRLLSPLLIYVLWVGVLAFAALVVRFYGGVMGVGTQGFLQSFTLVTASGVLAAGIFLGIKGGLTALGYEVDYVFTSPLKPHLFLASDIIFQLMLLNIFVIPSSSVIVIVLTHPRHLESLSLTIPIFEISILAAVLTSHLLGLARNWLGETLSRKLGWALMLYILLPILNIVMGWRIEIGTAVHPVYLVSGIFVDEWKTFCAAAYLIVLTSLYVVLSRKCHYSAFTPILVNVLTDPPKKFTFYLQPPRLLKGILSINPKDGPTVLILKVHLTRFIRDGSLWIAAFVLALITAANSVLPKLFGAQPFPEVAQLTLITLYTPLIPGLLSINWAVSERSNLWIIRLSKDGVKKYVVALLFSYAVVSCAFSGALFAVVLLGAREMPYLVMDLLLLVSASVFGSFFSVMTSTAVKHIPTPLSVTSLFLVITPLLGSVALSLPMLVVRLFEPFADSPSPPLLAGLLTYMTAMTAVLFTISKKAGEKSWDREQQLLMV